MTTSPHDTRLAPDVATLLHEHGLDGVPERPAPGGGYSASTLTVLERNGERFWLKRMSGDLDWLSRAMHDTSFREAEFAVSDLPDRLPASVRTPTLGAAYDGSGRALLMGDVSVIPDDSSRLTTADAQAIIDAAAEMHAAFWDERLKPARVSFCAPRDRLLTLTPATGQQLIDEGRDFGLARGWEVFRTLAPAPAIDLIDNLFHSVGGLLDGLDALPRTLVHGDLKVANIAVDQGFVWLLDWQVVSNTAVAMDLSWFLAVNSTRLPWRHDETIAHYEDALRARLDAKQWRKCRWELQLAMIYVTGLMSYGWGKALDAEAGSPDDLAWWCDHAVAAARDW